MPLRSFGNGIWEFGETFPNGTYCVYLSVQVKNGQVTIVPIDYHVELDGQPADWSTAYITDMRLENGYIFFENGNSTMGINPGVDYYRAYAVYQLNGTLSDMAMFDDIGRNNDRTGSGTTSTVISVNPEGKLFTEEVATEYHYTENDALYNLGKYGTQRKGRANISMTTFEAPGEDFCCWFDEAGQGVLIRYDHNPEGAIDPEVLTVWSMDHIDLIETAVVQWNHTHASPIFRYETAEAESESSNLTEEDILTRMNLELLNNQGPDVMILDGLNVEKYMEFMVPLDDLDTTGVYPGILDRFTVGGDLMALPARTVPYLLGRLAEGTQEINSLEQFADMVTSSGEVIDVRDIEDWQPHPGAQYHIRNYNQLLKQAEILSLEIILKRLITRQEKLQSRFQRHSGHERIIWAIRSDPTLQVPQLT